MNALEDALSAAPEPIRTAILTDFEALLRHSRREDWIDVGTRAGRLAENFLRLLYSRIGDSVPVEIDQFRDRCDRFGKIPAESQPKAVRILIPRALTVLYEIRNTRDFSHASPYVNSHQSDGAFVVATVKWVIAELVQLYQALPAVDAQVLVEQITRRDLPMTWTSSTGKFRVVDPSVELTTQIQVVLYYEGPMSPQRLAEHIGAPPARVLAEALELDEKHAIHFDQDSNTLELMPIGERHVEQVLIALGEKDAASTTFWSVAGGLYRRFLSEHIMLKPSYLLWRAPLEILKSEPGIGSLDPVLRAYLYASAVHQEVDIEFWSTIGGKTEESARELAWLATYTFWRSGLRAHHELEEFPKELRERARTHAKALEDAMYSTPLSSVETEEILRDIRNFQIEINSLPIDSADAMSRLGYRTDLVSRATAVIRCPDTAIASQLTERDKAFVLELAIFQRHRLLPQWLDACKSTMESAEALADAILRPGVRHQVRAAYELSQYSQAVRSAAVNSILKHCRSDVDRQLLVAVKSGQVGPHVLSGDNPLVRGYEGEEARQYVVARMNNEFGVA